MVFLVLLVVPLLVLLTGLVLSKGLVTYKEFALQVGVQIIVAGVSAFLVHYSSVHDTEVWNGIVTKKESEHVSCSHSYQCHCHEVCSGSGKNRSCSEECDTCYEHLYDVDWDVTTSNGEEIEIDRIDRQGIIEPPRFTSVVIGEPTAVEHGYTNYIKAAPDTLFRHQGLAEQFASSIPRYPEVSDYYRLNRILSVGGVEIPNHKAWNDALSSLNGEIGRSKQANVLLVLAKGLPQEYFYALEEAWIGAKKNDIVLVVGVGADLTPEWAAVMCWTTEEFFKIKLRDAVMSHGGPLTIEGLTADLRTSITQSFVRKPMADFEYLEASITPTPTQWTVSLFVSLLVAIILTIVCIKNDLFGDERRARLFAEALRS